MVGVGEVEYGGGEMASSGFRGTTLFIGGSENNGAIFSEQLREKWVVWNADANGFVMVIVEVFEFWVF